VASVNVAPVAPPTKADEAHARQKRGTRQLLAGRISFIASGYVVSVILARGLGPGLYGYYGILVSLITRIELITSAGIPGAIAKLIPEHREDPTPVEATARALLVAIGLAAFGLCWVAAPLVEYSFNVPNATYLFRIAALDVPATALYVSYTGILGGHRRFGHLAVAQMVYAASKVIGVLILLKLGMTVGGVLLTNALATMVACAFLLLKFPPSGFRPRPEVLRRIGAVAVPMGTYLIAAQVLSNMDLWALQVMWRGPEEVVGRYVAALNISRTLTIIPSVQSGVLFASLAWALAANDIAGVRRHIQEASRFALIAAAGALVVLAPDASLLMSTIFSSAYAPGGRFLEFQLVAFGVYGLLDAYAHTLVVAGRQWLAAGILLCLLPAAWLSNVLLIPRVGAVGAAMSLALGLSAGVVIMGAVTWRRFGALVRLATLARVALAAAVAVLVSETMAPVRGGWVVAKIGLIGFVYLGILVLSRELTAADLGMGKAPRAPGPPDVPGGEP
jgi:O-antigen/teichoic acid export membrane protein